MKNAFRRIEKIADETRVSAYFLKFFEALSKATSHFPDASREITCFGIGHFEDCLISRHQLAFILALRSELGVERISFHEPILSRAEIEILRKLDCDVWSKNLEGKVLLDSAKVNIVFSPHCPKQLTNNLLWRNWCPTSLRSLVYIGNSFGNLLNSTPSRYLETDAKFVVRIHPFAEEVPIENSYRFSDIFNDTSIHVFPSERLSSLSESFWQDETDEPNYTEDIELITSDIISKLNI